MMIDKHALWALVGSASVHRRLDDLYNRELFERDWQPPWYRRFIVATRDADDPALPRLRGRYERPEPAPMSPSRLI